MKKIRSDNTGSAIPIFEYIAAIIIFGLVYWFLNGILTEFTFVSATGDTYNLGMYIWVAIIIVFLIGASVYVIRRYTKKQYGGGY